ncbi:MAG: hypothetical protein ACUVWZ_16500, partial [Anaerolineae bacterium]
GLACQRIGERMNEWVMDPAIRSFVIHSVTGHGGLSPLRKKDRGHLSKPPGWPANESGNE